MSFELKIKGFKCFKENSFEIKKINVLTGNNGTGKSSFIQAILLCRIIIENTCFINREGFLSNKYRDIEFKLDLNNHYCLKLGTESDVVRQDTSHSEVFFNINNDLIKLFLNKNQTDNLSLSSISNFRKEFNPIKNREFYYLNAEREGPRHSQENLSFDFLHCGSQGENTAFAILSAERLMGFNSAIVKEGKRFKNSLDFWVDFLFPGIIISSIPVSTTVSQIKLRTSIGISDLLSTNIGFGISYALPVIVNGLLAKEESMFIVENPEAHLHPKAQSNIGAFLGYLALNNVNVIIETHSEHVINGIRKVLINKEIDLSNLEILFFKEMGDDKEVDIDKISMDKEGNLSLFPIDFFDQVRQDLLEIRNLSINGESFNF